MLLNSSIYFLGIFFVVFYLKICVFIIFISFLISIEFAQQNINQSEKWIGGFQLSLDLYVTRKS